MDIDGDGDLKVEVDGKIWLLNPVSCTQHFDTNQQKIARPAAVDVRKTVSQSSSKCYSPITLSPLLCHLSPTLSLQNASK